MRNVISTLKPYDPSLADVKIDLHANEVNTNLNLFLKENILQSLNRYPDHQGEALRHKLQDVYGYNPNTIIIGSGSSELLELMVKTFVDTNDIVLSLEPTFIMYQHYTVIHGGTYVSIPYSTNTLDDLHNAYVEKKPALIFISNPNNPTGDYIKKEDLIDFIQQVSCPIVIDEAYIEYVDEKESLAYDIQQFKNLYVTRTFSKAFALAGARLGYMVSQQENIQHLKRAKTPYSVSTLSLALGIEALNQKETMQTIISSIIKTRNEMFQYLQQFPLMVSPSYGNFLYLYEPNKDLYALLLNKSIYIRYYQNGYYRMSIGTIDEMQEVKKAFKEIYHDTF